MKYDENTVHGVCSGVVVIYSGVKKSSNGKDMHHLYMCTHVAMNCIEIFANSPVPGEEDHRIYVNADMVISKLENGVLMAEFDRRMKELLRLNQYCDRVALLKDVTSKLVVNFLLDRIKIREETESFYGDKSISSESRFALYMEPKPKDKTENGFLDFQFESKPVKLRPVKIAESGVVMRDSEDNSDMEEEETGLDEPKATDAKIWDRAGSELSEIDLERPLVEEEVGLLSTKMNLSNSTRTNVMSICDDEEDVTVDCNGDDNKRRSESDDIAAVAETEDQPVAARRALTRKRSMSESDLFLKAAALASLTVETNTESAVAVESEGTPGVVLSEPVATAHSGASPATTRKSASSTGGRRSSLDDSLLHRRGSLGKGGGGQLQLDPLQQRQHSDFHYGDSLPVDEKLPSYLANTCSNYAKKLPPLSPTTATASGFGTRPGTATARPTTACGSRPNTVNLEDAPSGRSAVSSACPRQRRISLTSVSQPHTHAVGRIHDLKHSHEVHSMSGLHGLHCDSEAKKSPQSVTGVVTMRRASLGSVVTK